MRCIALLQEASPPTAQRAGSCGQLSPCALCRLPQTSTFQEELDAYVRALNLPLGDARRMLRLIAVHDFSAARAHIVASGRQVVGPGARQGNRNRGVCRAG